LEFDSGLAAMIAITFWCMKTTRKHYSYSFLAKLKHYQPISGSFDAVLISV
jgi:hypothetical protein